jgi:hypothetical protein
MKLGQSKGMELQRKFRGNQIKTRDNAPSLVTEHELQIQLHWPFFANAANTLDSHGNFVIRPLFIA